MEFIKRNAKRIVVDGAGYLLLLAAALTGWLPGPGGIPLALAGLGLLSINNEWAQRLRTYLLDHGGKVVQYIFPKNRFVEWTYDILVVVVLGVVTWLAIVHAAIWQISLATALFFIALAVALLNRDRYNRLKSRNKHKQ
ncbi:MAG: hypothetical protein ABIR37_00120 [Candidatus Saccharimonadales bacterium]